MYISFSIVYHDCYCDNRHAAESALPVIQLSAEQERAAKQSLKVYCQPIEYYNILHDRALDKVNYFLCLLFKSQSHDCCMGNDWSIYIVIT